jgi:hypothetical protein
VHIVGILGHGEDGQRIGETHAKGDSEIPLLVGIHRDHPPSTTGQLAGQDGAQG